MDDYHEEDMITETEAKKHGIPVRFIYEVIRAKTDLNFYNAVKETYACGEKLYMLNERCIVSREKLPSTIEKRWMNDFKSVDDFKRFPWESIGRAGMGTAVPCVSLIHYLTTGLSIRFLRTVRCPNGVWSSYQPAI